MVTDSVIPIYPLSRASLQNVLMNFQNRPWCWSGYQLFSLWADVEAEYKDEAVAVSEQEIGINTTSCVHRALGKPVHQAW